MSVKIVRDDYQEGDYEPLEVWANPPRDRIWPALVQWLRDDWRYCLFLSVLLIYVWVFGPGGK